MTLRLKTLLVVGIAVLGLMAVTVSLSWNMLKRNYLAGEETIARDNAVRVKAALSAEVDNVVQKGGDWSMWDDAYQFVQDRNEAFATSNLQPLAFQTLDFQYFVFVDSRKRIVFGHAGGGRDAVGPAGRARGVGRAAGPRPVGSRNGHGGCGSCEYRWYAGRDCRPADTQQ
jgi:sensor domain CHASE-containing protein